MNKEKVEQELRNLLKSVGDHCLTKSTEIISGSLRKNVVEVSKLKEVFALYGVELKEENPF